MPPRKRTSTRSPSARATGFFGITPYVLLGHALLASRERHHELAATLHGRPTRSCGASAPRRRHRRDAPAQTRPRAAACRARRCRIRASSRAWIDAQPAAGDRAGTRGPDTFKGTADEQPMEVSRPAGVRRRVHAPLAPLGAAGTGGGQVPVHESADRAHDTPIVTPTGVSEITPATISGPANTTIARCLRCERDNPHVAARAHQLIIATGRESAIRLFLRGQSSPSGGRPSA